MKVTSYQNLVLAWEPRNKQDKLFVALALFVLGIFLGSGIYLGSIELPKQERKARVEIPERVAKFILERPKPKVKPKPKPVEMPKTKPKPKVKRKKPKDEIKLTKKQMA